MKDSLKQQNDELENRNKQLEEELRKKENEIKKITDQYEHEKEEYKKKEKENNDREYNDLMSSLQTNSTKSLIDHWVSKMETKHVERRRIQIDQDEIFVSVVILDKVYSV